MSSQELKILNQQILHLGDNKLSYYLLEDNQVYFSQKEFNKYIGLTNKTGKPILYQNQKSIFFTNSSVEADIALPIEKIVNFCASKIEEILKGDSDVNMLFKCLHLLKVLSEKGANQLVIEIKTVNHHIEPVPEKDVKFDDLLAGLMRVPPPKKGK